MLITHIQDDVTEYFLNTLEKLKSVVTPPDYDNTLTKEVWWSGNVVNLLQDFHFSKNAIYLRNIVEKTFHCRLFYNYIHFIDYSEGNQIGSSMDFHSHEHNEDYAYILYLNDCLDGETNFYMQDLICLRPKKSQLVIFESHIKHSASLSFDKKVLVCGMTKYKGNA